MEPIKIIVKDPKKAMEQATKRIAKAGGKIGEEKWSASTPLGDVSGTYLIEGNTVTINVKKKDSFYQKILLKQNSGIFLLEYK